jgi:hypothetical protein
MTYYTVHWEGYSDRSKSIRRTAHLDIRPVNMQSYSFNIIVLVVCIVYNVLFIARAAESKKGVADVLKRIPQGLQCLPYKLPGTGATLCYKFASSLKLGEDVISRSVDKMAQTAAATYTSLNGCVQRWRTDKLKEIMCKRHNGHTWFLKMQKSSNAGHYSCTLKQAIHFVNKACKGRERRPDDGGKTVLIQMLAKQQNKLKMKALISSQLKVFRLSEQETVRMFGQLKGNHPLSGKEAMLQIFKKLGIPTKLTAQVGIKTDKDGFKAIFTLANLGESPSNKPYCVNMLDLLKFMAASTMAMPVTPILNTLTKYTAGYWNAEKFVKSIGKYCIKWDMAFDGDLVDLTFNKASMGMVHSCDFNLPGLYGLWQQVKYDMKQSPIFKVQIIKDAERKYGMKLDWEHMKMPKIIPDSIKKIQARVKSLTKNFMNHATKKDILSMTPKEIIAENSMCKEMYVNSFVSHCEKCTDSIFPLVTKQKTIFEGDSSILNWRVLVNKKAPEDVIPHLETGGYEICMAASKTRTHCHCSKGITQEDEVDYCNADFVRMMVEKKEKQMPIDQTEVGKMYKQLISTPGGGDDPLYLSIMLRIGELYKLPTFQKKKSSIIAKQICYETQCGCKNQDVDDGDHASLLKGQGY